MRVRFRRGPLSPGHPNAYGSFTTLPAGLSVITIRYDQPIWRKIHALGHELVHYFIWRFTTKMSPFVTLKAGWVYAEERLDLAFEYFERLIWWKNPRKAHYHYCRWVDTLLRERYAWFARRGVPNGL